MKTKIQITETQFEDMRIALNIAQVALQSTIDSMRQADLLIIAQARQADLDKVNLALANSEWNTTKRIYE
jgi:hypothetical protein